MHWLLALLSFSPVHFTSTLKLLFSRRTNMTRSVLGGIEVQVFYFSLSTNLQILQGLNSDSWFVYGCAWSNLKLNSVFRSCWDGDSLAPYWLSTFQQLFWFLIVFLEDHWSISVFCICIFNFRLSYLTWPTISSLSFLRLLSLSTWQLCWCGSFWDIVACVWQSCRYS